MNKGSLLPGIIFFAFVTFPEKIFCLDEVASTFGESAWVFADPVCENPAELASEMVSHLREQYLLKARIFCDCEKWRFGEITSLDSNVFNCSDLFYFEFRIYESDVTKSVDDVLCSVYVRVISPSKIYYDCLFSHVYNTDGVAHVQRQHAEYCQTMNCFGSDSVEDLVVQMLQRLYQEAVLTHKKVVNSLTACEFEGNSQERLKIMLPGTVKHIKSTYVEKESFVESEDKWKKVVVDLSRQPILGRAQMVYVKFKIYENEATKPLDDIFCSVHMWLVQPSEIYYDAFITDYYNAGGAFCVQRRCVVGGCKRKSVESMEYLLSLVCAEVYKKAVEIHKETIKLSKNYIPS